MKLRTQIILAMTSLMVASLLVIGAVTVFFFKEQNEQYHRERLARKERAIKTEMAYFTKEAEAQENADIVVKDFEEEVLRLATVHGMDISVFNTNGYILVSAQPDSIRANLDDRRVPPVALEQLAMFDRVVLPDTDEGTNVLSDYTVLRNAKGERIAILHLPYRPEAGLNKNDLSGFLRSIGITYAFLFLAAIGLTLLLSNTITRNIQLLSERLNTLDLNRVNEPILWRKKDEIGTLVAAYNAMLLKLQESRALLAKTERESAWREMARQVAHEIKNPLTPIKLSVQHLQATANFQDEVWQRKFQETMALIIQQTESLSSIATDFSDFASMPRLHAEPTLLAPAIREVAALLSDESSTILVEIQDESLAATVDADGLRRVLTNLVKNAKQATEHTTNPSIAVRLAKSSGQACIEVIDNGVGITAEQQSRIFVPNFTTKSSGTGLGLAISKQIVEHAGGHISFTSETGVQTVFRVMLPPISGANR